MLASLHDAASAVLLLMGRVKAKHCGFRAFLRDMITKSQPELV